MTKGIAIGLMLWVFGLGLYFTRETLGFYSDSAHLVRPYSPAERRQAWRGNWDPDSVENPGYRPLMTLFFDRQYRLLGESAPRHRYALVTLWWVCGIFVLHILSFLGLSTGFAVLAVMLWQATPYNATHIAWISDGIHIFQVFLVAPAAICWLWRGRVAGRGARFSLGVAGFLWAGAALLTRDDSLPMIAVAASLPALDAFRHRESWKSIARRLGAYAAAVLAMTLLFFWVRAQALEGIPSPYAFSWHEWTYGVFRLIPGLFARGAGSRLAGLFYLAGLAWVLYRHPTPRSLCITGFLGIFLLLSSVHMTVVARENLVIFPTLVFAVALCAGLAYAHSTDRVMFRGLLLGLALIFCFAIRENRRQQQKFLPKSLMSLSADIRTLYGPNPVTLPPMRRQNMEANLREAGLGNLSTLREDFNRLSDRCGQDNRERIGAIVCVPGVRLSPDFSPRQSTSSPM